MPSRSTLSRPFSTQRAHEGRLSTAAAPASPSTTGNSMWGELRGRARVGALLLVGARAVPHERLRQLPDGRGRGASPPGLRRGEVRPAEGAQAPLRPGQLLPHQPEHPARLARGGARSSRASTASPRSIEPPSPLAHVSPSISSEQFISSKRSASPGGGRETFGIGAPHGLRKRTSPPPSVSTE